MNLVDLLKKGSIASTLWNVVKDIKKTRDQDELDKLLAKADKIQKSLEDRMNTPIDGKMTLGDLLKKDRKRFEKEDKAKKNR
jgi:hypothetical protein